MKYQTLLNEHEHTAMPSALIRLPAPAQSLYHNLQASFYAIISARGVEERR